MVAIPPGPREGPFSSSHSWATTETRLQPVPGGGCETPGEGNGELVIYRLFFIPALKDSWGGKGMMGSP